MDMDALAARVTARRAKAGLVSNGGIACPTQQWVDYYNARDQLPRDENGLRIATPETKALKAAAIRSTSK